jgi:hypothetical protein
MLLRHQPDPGRKAAPRCKRLPIANLGNQSRGDDRADAGYLRQAPARIARAMQGQDALIDRSDLGSKGAVLPRQRIKNAAGGRWQSVIPAIRDDPKQLCRSIAAFGRHDAKFGEVPTEGVAQHRALTHQQLPGPVQHQGCLLLLRLDRNKAHRWPRDSFADRGSIVGVVLAAFKIGLHIARRHHTVWPSPVSSRPQ